MRRRGERIERSSAHCYDTGGMRRVRLRGRENVLKRLLVHVGGLDLGLVMRKLCGKGTPRGLQGLSLRLSRPLLDVWAVLASLLRSSAASGAPDRSPHYAPTAA
jgi:transposase